MAAHKEGVLLPIRIDPSRPYEFEYDDTMITRYCGDGGEVVIPEGVTDLFFEVFSANSQITGVRIPGSMTAVTPFVFEGCTALRSATLEEGVCEIGCAAFRDCSALEEIVLPRSLTKIDKHALAGCTALRSIRFGGSPEEWTRVERREGWDSDTEGYTVIPSET